MSGPNTMFSEPRERDDEVATAAPPLAPPGVMLELERLGPLLDDAVMLFHRDIKPETDLAALEAHLEKLSSICTHARKTVTALRVQQRSRPKE